MKTKKIATLEKNEAEARAESMRAHGYPTARAYEQDPYGTYGICTHAVSCTCGCCPVLYDDGTVE